LKICSKRKGKKKKNLRDEGENNKMVGIDDGAKMVVEDKDFEGRENLIVVEKGL
jgi:hypothetical protein